MNPAVIAFPNISPEIFSIAIGNFEFALRWYALAYIAGLFLGYRLILRMMRMPRLWQNNTAPMQPAEVEDLLTWITLGVIIGGRLGFVLFYEPAYYLSDPGDILKIWQGGMAFHGGFLGVVVAAWIFAKRNGIPLWSLADSLAIAAPIGIFFGRIANFINGELWGRAADVPWAMIFPDPRSQTCPGVEGICARHPSQLYEALIEGLILGAILIYFAFRKDALKIPGQIAALFFMGYGIGRFIVEHFRQPDLQFVTPDNPMGYVMQFFGTGITMGQLLSLPMILAGLVLLTLARQRAVK